MYIPGGGGGAAHVATAILSLYIRGGVTLAGNECCTISFLVKMFVGDPAILDIQPPINDVLVTASLINTVNLTRGIQNQ